MRFLLDEGADVRLAPYLRGLGHDVTRLAVDYPAGLPDPRGLAAAEGRVLLTNDRDLGELVFRLRQSRAGAILFRLGNYAELATKLERLDHVLAHHADQLRQFLAVSDQRVRVRPAPGEQEVSTFWAGG
jgi:predicted nuclease of predicted toxin-antitoxin system